MTTFDITRPKNDAEKLRFALHVTNNTPKMLELRFPDSAQQNVRPQEIAMAEQLIGNLAETFDPSKYHDEYEEKLKKVDPEANSTPGLVSDF